MNRFVKGARVKVVNNVDETEWRVGQLATVEKYEQGDAYPVRVIMDDGTWLLWKESELEVVKDGPNVKVIEGELCEMGGEWFLGDYNISTMGGSEEFFEEHGKFRITLEKLEDAPAD